MDLMTEIKDKSNLLRWVEISHSALLHNLKIIRQNLQGKTMLACVIKSNAYGHGLAEVSGIIDKYIDAYIITNLDEAEQLRNDSSDKMIINIGHTMPDYAASTVNLGVKPVIYSLETANMLNHAAEKAGKNLDVFVKVETGMNRCGVQGEELDKLMLQIKKLPNISVLGLSSHFARSDEEDPVPTRIQIEKFNRAIERYRQEGHSLELCHCANTGAIFLFPESHYDLVRLGVGLYGFPPSDFVGNSSEFELQRVLEYKTRIIQTREVNKGETVSYGGTWTADRKRLIAILPAGYADGYLRALSNRGEVLVRGHRAPITGRICMNNFVIDVSDIPQVETGDEVTLISSDTDSGITATDLAEKAGTIHYEITTMIPEKISRIVV